MSVPTQADINKYEQLIRNFQNLPRAGSSMSANARRNNNKTVVIKKYNNSANAGREFDIHSMVYRFPAANIYMVKPLYRRNSYFVQEYQPKMLDTLDVFISKIKRSNKFDLNKSREIFKDILNQIKTIVKFLKSYGVRHNDLHLGNFIVYRKGKKFGVKVIDFGKAIFTDNRTQPSQISIERLARFGQYADNGWLIENAPETHSVVPRYQFNAMVDNALKAKAMRNGNRVPLREIQPQVRTNNASPKKKTRYHSP